MYQKKLKEDIRCPLERGLAQFGGKWDSRILCVLFACGTLRYGEIRREMVDITDTALTATLKKLISDGLIERHSFDEATPHVEYSLSERGKTVIPIMQSICQWAGAESRGDGSPSLRQCQKCDFNQKEEE